MLLTIFAIVVGSGIGHLRGGDSSGASKVQLRASPLLVVAVATVLVQIVLNPVFPFVWSLVSVAAFIGFATMNRHLTGMSIMLIGAVLNLLPMLLNGATPVSELALMSVGDLTPFDLPNVSGARESSLTATRLSFLGDAIPVPIFGAVVSIGDLIGLVGLTSVVTNLFLSANRHNVAPSNAGVSFGSTKGTGSGEKVSILSPLQVAGRSATNLAHRRPRRKAAPTSHVPAHAAGPLVDLVEPAVHVPAHADDDLDVLAVDEADVALLEEVEAPALETLEGPTLDDVDVSKLFDFEAPDESASTAQVRIEDEPTVELDVVPAPAPVAPTPAVESTDGDPIILAGVKAVPVYPAADMPTAVLVDSDEVVEVIDLTDPNDPRPIIDLTSSPTDEQMTEFLRRRRAADREIQRVPIRPAGQRRGRAPVRIRTNALGGVVESTS